MCAKTQTKKLLRIIKILLELLVQKYVQQVKSSSKFKDIVKYDMYTLKLSYEMICFNFLQLIQPPILVLFY